MNRGRGPTVVVLGASGYLGSVVAGMLAQRPVRLRAVTRRPPSLPEPPRAQIEVATADLAEPDQLAATVGDADAVLHLAKHSGDWRDPERSPAETERVNVGVMRSLVDILATRRATTAVPPLVVFAGACTQIGRPPDRPMDGTEPDHPETEYDRQKLAAERILETATAEGVVRGVSLRLATVFGHSSLSRKDDVGVVTSMIRRALADQPLTMWHDGSVVRDVTYIEDVAAAFLAALDRPDRLVGRHWLIGTGHHHRLGDVFRRVAASVAARTGRQPVPVVSVPPPPGAVVTDFLHVFIDPAPFQTAAGWSAQLSIREGIDRTVSALLDSSELAGTGVQRSKGEA